MPILTAEDRLATLFAGRYRLESILGKGGMGVVFEGTHSWTGRRVAVKLLKPQHTEDLGLVRRFLQEARSAAGISHPHVVQVLDMGSDEDGTVYLVMELLEGSSLGRRLEEESPLSAAECLTLLVPIMDALGEAHGAGVIHRDLKPDNVFLHEDGRGQRVPKLLDFGMSKMLDAEWGRATQSGTLIGTPFYMSPEQAEGRPDQGPASDVWSMGVMLYRCLSGALPFHAETPTALLLSIVRDRPRPLAELEPSVPPAIAAVVDRALAADLDRRIPDMPALLAALREAARQDGVPWPVAPHPQTAEAPEPFDPGPPVPAPRARGSWLWAGAAAAAVVIAIAIGVAALSGDGATPGEEEPEDPRVVTHSTSEEAVGAGETVPTDGTPAAEVTPEPPGPAATAGETVPAGSGGPGGGGSAGRADPPIDRHGDPRRDEDVVRRHPGRSPRLWMALATLGLASITLGSGHATAQPAADEGEAETADASPREAEARALFEQGLAYRDQERWGEALEYFRRSWQRVERPSTAFNMAVVLLRLARPSETLRALDDYLRISDPEAEAVRREEARRLLEQALGSIARLTLTVDPTTAIVRVDGQPVGGEGAVRELRLDPGTHSMRVEAEGYEPQTLEVAVLDGEVSRRAITLVRRPQPTGPALLRITASVTTATIHLDGEAVGQGTWIGEVEPGRHRVEVRDEGFVPFRRTLEAEPGEQLEVQAALSRREEGGLLDSPLFWIVAGALVVAAGVGVGVALASGTEDPYGGTTGVVLLGLRRD